MVKWQDKYFISQLNIESALNHWFSSNWDCRSHLYLGLYMLRPRLDIWNTFPFKWHTTVHSAWRQLAWLIPSDKKYTQDTRHSLLVSKNMIWFNYTFSATLRPRSLWACAACYRSINYSRVCEYMCVYTFQKFKWVKVYWVKTQQCVRQIKCDLLFMNVLALNEDQGVPV